MRTIEDAVSKGRKVLVFGTLVAPLRALTRLRRRDRGRGDGGRDAALIPLVETRAGLDAIEAICAVEGLAGLLVGPFDLSVSLGRAGDYLCAEVDAAIGRLCAAARAAGLPILAPIFDPDAQAARAQRDTWEGRGASLFVTGTDKIVLADAMSRYRAAVTLSVGARPAVEPRTTSGASMRTVRGDLSVRSMCATRVSTAASTMSCAGWRMLVRS